MYSRHTMLQLGHVGRGRKLGSNKTLLPVFEMLLPALMSSQC